MARRFGTDDEQLAALLRDQDGVVARPQMLELGGSANDIDRMLRHRDLSRVHPGVFVNHTGSLTPRQREWRAVLAAAPAALADESALPVRAPGTIRIAVAHHRKLVLPPGVSMRRVLDLDDRVLWQRMPPRMRVEHALLDAMSSRIAIDDIAAAFTLLAQVVTARATTADRVLATLHARTRLAGRRILEGMLTDASRGASSVLERGYCTGSNARTAFPRRVGSTEATRPAR